MSHKDLRVGQIVYVIPWGNTVRRYGNEIVEATVAKIGRKYFYLEESRFDGDKFDLENFIYNSGHNSGWNAYLTKQEILDKREHERLSKEIVNMLNTWTIRSLSLEQLRAIKEAIERK